MRSRTPIQPVCSPGGLPQHSSPSGFPHRANPESPFPAEVCILCFFFYCKQKFRVQQLCSCKSSLECLPSWNNDKNNNRWTYIKSEKLMWG